MESHTKDLFQEYISNLNMPLNDTAKLSFNPSPYQSSILQNQLLNQLIYTDKLKSSNDQINQSRSSMINPNTINMIPNANTNSTNTGYNNQLPNTSTSTTSSSAATAANLSSNYELLQNMMRMYGQQMFPPITTPAMNPMELMQMNPLYLANPLGFMPAAGLGGFNNLANATTASIGGSGMNPYQSLGQPKKQENVRGGGGVGNAGGDDVLSNMANLYMMMGNQKSFFMPNHPTNNINLSAMMNQTQFQPQLNSKSEFQDVYNNNNNNNNSNNISNTQPFTLDSNNTSILASKNELNHLGTGGVGGYHEDRRNQEMGYDSRQREGMERKTQHSLDGSKRKNIVDEEVGNSVNNGLYGMRNRGDSANNSRIQESKKIINFDDIPIRPPKTSMNSFGNDTKRRPSQVSNDNEDNVTTANTMNNTSGMTPLVERKHAFDDIPIGGRAAKRFEDLLEEQLTKNPYALGGGDNPSSQYKPKSRVTEQKREFLRKGTRQYLSNAQQKPKKDQSTPHDQKESLPLNQNQSFLSSSSSPLLSFPFNSKSQVKGLGQVQLNPTTTLNNNNNNRPFTSQSLKSSTTTLAATSSTAIGFKGDSNMMIDMDNSVISNKTNIPTKKFLMKGGGKGGGKGNMSMTMATASANANANASIMGGITGALGVNASTGTSGGSNATTTMTMKTTLAKTMKGNVGNKTNTKDEDDEDSAEEGSNSGNLANASKMNLNKKQEQKRILDSMNVGKGCLMNKKMFMKSVEEKEEFNEDKDESNEDKEEFNEDKEEFNDDKEEFNEVKREFNKVKREFNKNKEEFSEDDKDKDDDNDNDHVNKVNKGGDDDDEEENNNNSDDDGVDLDDEDGYEDKKYDYGKYLRYNNEDADESNKPLGKDLHVFHHSTNTTITSSNANTNANTNNEGSIKYKFDDEYEWADTTTATAAATGSTTTHTIAANTIKGSNPSRNLNKGALNEYKSGLLGSSNNNSPPKSSIVKKYFYGDSDDKDPKKSKKAVLGIAKDKENEIGCHIDKEDKEAKGDKGDKGDKIQRLLKERIELLDSEIAKVRLENELALKKKNRYDEMLKGIEKEKMEWLKQKEKEREEFEEWKQEEIKKIKKEKRVAEQTSKVLQNMPNRKERDEIDSLKKQLSKITEDLKITEKKHQLYIDRLKKQVTELTTHNQELQQEIKYYEQLRINGKLSIGIPIMSTKANNTSSGGSGTNGSGSSSAIQGNMIDKTKMSNTMGISTNNSTISVSKRGLKSKDEEEDDKLSRIRRNESEREEEEDNSDEDEDESRDKRNEDDDDDNDEDDDDKKERNHRSYEDIVNNYGKPANEKHSSSGIFKPVVNQTKKGLISGSQPQGKKANMALEDVGNDRLNATLSTKNANVGVNSLNELPNKNQSDSYINPTQRSLLDRNLSKSRLLPTATTTTTTTATPSLKKPFSETDYRYDGNSYYLNYMNTRIGGQGNSSNKIISQSVSGEGKIQRLYQNGKKEVIFHNGVKRETYPDGYTIVHFTNNDIKQTLPDNTIIYYFADAKTTQTTLPTGQQIYRFSNNQVEFHYPNGAKDIYFSDGTMKHIGQDGEEETAFNDGTIQKIMSNKVKMIGYSNGQKDMIYPDGMKIRTFPDGRVKKYYPDGHIEDT